MKSISDPARKKRRRIRRKVLFAVILVAAGVVIPGELVLRALGTFDTFHEKDVGTYESYFGKRMDSWVWTHSPSGSFRYPNAEFNYEVRTNREGIRDVDHVVEKPAGCYRIVVLGDSCTEGLGSPFEQVWWKDLERRLQARGDPVELIGGGVCGNDIFYCYRLLEQRLLRYAPDLVVVALNESDLPDHTFRGGMERFQPDGTTRFREGPWFESVYEHSHLARLVLHRVLGYDWRLIKHSAMDEANRAAEDAILACVDEFSTLSRANGFDLFVLVHPTGTELLDGHRGFSPALTEGLAARGVAHADVDAPLRALIHEKNVLDYVWPINEHLNGDGNVLFAGLVLPILEERYLAPRRRKEGR